MKTAHVCLFCKERDDKQIVFISLSIYFKNVCNVALGVENLEVRQGKLKQRQRGGLVAGKGLLGQE